MKKLNLRSILFAATMLVASLFVGCNTEEVDYDTPYIKISEGGGNVALIPTTGGNAEVTIETNRPWKIEYIKDAATDKPANWLRATPESGDGGATITFTALPLEDGVDREALIKVSTATVWEVIRISQKGTMSLTTLLKETCGTGDVSQKPAVGIYTSWSKEGLGAQNVTYSGIAADKVTVRTTSGGASSGYPNASGGNYVYFGSAAPNSFFINNIETGGATNFRLSFGTSRYDGNASTQEPVTNEVVKAFYSITGAENSYTEIPIAFSNIAGKWQLVSTEFTTATTEKLFIQLTCTVSSQVSVDDFTVTTTQDVNLKPAPTVTTTSAKDITDTGATVGGSYTYTGSETITEVGVEYKKPSADTFTAKAATSVATTFSVAIADLTKVTGYVARAYVKIGAKTFYGSEETFTTTGTLDTKTITAVRAAVVNGAAVDPAIIKGTVVSDSIGRNVQSYQFAMVDGNGEDCGVMINVAEKNVRSPANLGDKVQVDLTGATYNVYNGLIQIVVSKDNISKISTAPGNTTPVVVTADKILQYESMLISVAEIQVAQADIAKTMNGNVNVVTKSGIEFIMRTGSTATFKTDNVPQGSGTIIGLSSRFNDDAQVAPRTMADVSSMTGARFLAFDNATFTATTANADEALVDAKLNIPYFGAVGTETYNAIVTVSGIGMGTIPATINQALTITAAGNGTLEIPVSGTPTAGEVTFSIAGITTEAIVVTKTFIEANISTFKAAWSMFGNTTFGTTPMAPTTTAANVTIGDLTKNYQTDTSNPGSNNWGGKDFVANTEATTLTAPTYFATFTATSAKVFSLSSLEMIIRATAKGPMMTSVQYSIDGGAYTELKSIVFTRPSKTTTFPKEIIDLSGIAALQDITANKVVTFRIVPVANTGTEGGNWYLNSANATTDALIISGSVTK